MSLLRHGFLRLSIYEFIAVLLLVTLYTLYIAHEKSTIDQNLSASLRLPSNVYDNPESQAPLQVETSSNLPSTWEFYTTPSSTSSKTTLVTIQNDALSEVVATSIASVTAPAFEKVLVMAKLAAENTSWVAENLAEFAARFPILYLCSC